MQTEGIIIRGDDQTISVPVPAGAFTTLIGAKAFLTVKPTTAVASDDGLDTAAIIKCNLGAFNTEPTSFDFVLTSQAGQPNSSVVPVGLYAWGAQVVTASGKVTTIELSPPFVEVKPDVTRRTT